MTTYTKKQQLARKSRRIGDQSRKNIRTTKEMVEARDDYRCVAATSSWARLYPCAGGITTQHAIARGMGGSAAYDGPEWLRTFCAFHNGLDASDATFHNFAMQHGWAIPRLLIGVSWREVPVLYPDGDWYLLPPLEDGKRELDRIRIPVIEVPVMRRAMLAKFGMAVV